MGFLESGGFFTLTPRAFRDYDGLFKGNHTHTHACTHPHMHTQLQTHALTSKHPYTHKHTHTDTDLPVPKDINNTQAPVASVMRLDGPSFSLGADLSCVYVCVCVCVCLCVCVCV